MPRIKTANNITRNKSITKKYWELRKANPNIPQYDLYEVIKKELNISLDSETIRKIIASTTKLEREEIIFLRGKYEVKAKEYEILTILKDNLTPEGIEVYNKIKEWLKINLDKYLELINL